MKVRKKPIEVEAERFTGKNGLYLAAWSGGKIRTAELTDSKDSRYVKIQTMEGLMTGDVGDYIIKGVNGEFYPVKPDIFVKTYDIL